MIRASRREAALLVVLDVLFVSAAFALAYVLRFRYEWLATVDVAAPPTRNYAHALAVVLPVFLVVLRGRGLYEHLPPRGIDALEGTLGGVTFASLIVLSIGFFYREFSYSRSVCLIAWVLMGLALPLPRLCLLVARRRRLERGVGLVPALVVGSSPRALELVARLRDHRRFGLDLRGIVSAGGWVQDPQSALAAGAPAVGSVDDLEDLVRATGAREVLISDTLARLTLFEVLETCERLDVGARIVPHVADLFVRPDDLDERFGVPFIAVREQRFELLSLALKRVFDLVLGGLLALLTLPLVIALALLVRRESPGPALFRQRRVGQGGRVFHMWKLRSMVVDAEARLSGLVDLETLPQPVYKLEDDPRVTRIGRRLRRWSLDELPQFWNVLRGDMSLVGPRPEVEPVVARYDAHQRRRLKAKPGVTGLQQVEARAVNDLDERIRHDVYYIRRRSFLFDVWILLRTPWAVLHGRGAT